MMNVRETRISVFQDKIEDCVLSDSPISSLTLSGRRTTRLRVNNPNSDWMINLRNRFDELASLPNGWDGYKGKPVSFTCAQFAANLIESLCDDDLPPPSLVPGSDGTLQIEWHRNEYDIEIDVLGPYQIVATRFDHITGEGNEIELTSDFSQLASWLSDLKKVRRAVA